MNTQEILGQLNSIFRETLNNENIVLNENTTANDIDEWDSLTNISIITNVEKNFNMKFKIREIMKLKNVGDLCELILRKL